MHKYLTLLGTSLIIFLALFVIFSHNVSANTVITGNACSESDVQNWINSNVEITLDWTLEGHHPDDCTNPSPTPTPTATPTPTLTPTPTVTPTATPTPAQNNNPGGPGDGRSDGLGCASNDCSGNQVGGSTTPTNTQAVLGASTGPQVLGLSTTSGEENYLLQIVQVLGALTSVGLGFVFFKK